MSSPSSQPRTRQELYERIRATSREEFILEEMIRLGFWPAQGELPQDPADEIRRRGELQRQLGELRTESRRLYNEEALIKEMRERRFAESRRKQQENKARREQERQQRAAAWLEKKAGDIVYLGEEVSGGLNNINGDDARLESNQLPLINTANQIAEAMKISIGELRFLSFSRKTATTSHYQRFKIPKKTGGERIISAPMPRLKAAQHWILENILAKIELDVAAHGFRPYRSIVTNARPHVAADVIINIDLKDFFPTVSYKRVKGLFRSFGYSEAAATIFALICSEPDVEEVELDGKRYYVALGDRHLPQGAPTSPAITNILCRRLDRRLTKTATKLGFNYTRYADDLTFSASGEHLRNICNMLGEVDSIVRHEGFNINEKKTRVLRKARQQEVTGIVVNSRINISRKTLKNFRATLFQIEKDGLTGKRWGQSQDLIASLFGFANFVFMVDAEKGAELRARVRAIADKHNWSPAKRPIKVKPADTTPAVEPAPSSPPTSTSPTESSEVKDSPKKWWKLW